MVDKQNLKNKLTPKYNKEYEGFCYQNCMREILDYYQCENYDFYINMSLSTLMVTKENRYFLCYDNNAHGIIPSKANKIYRKDDKRNCECVFSDNMRKINEGYPVIACVDGFYLKYFSYYKVKHCRHYLIITGEKDNGDVTVLDWYPPHFYCGEIERKVFFVARESDNPDDGNIYSGFPIKNNWAWIEREGWEQSREELIYENLDISLKQYFPNNNDKQNVVGGVMAFRKIKDELEKIILMEQKIRGKNLRYMYNELYQTVKRKYLFCYFLRLINNEMKGDDLVGKAIVYVQKLINEWEKFMTVLLKYSFRGKEADIYKLLDMLLSLSDVEEGLYDYVFCLKIKL